MRSLIVAPETRWGSLGRGLAAAASLGLLGEVTVAAFDDGPLWVGSDTFAHPVTTFSTLQELCELARALDAGDGEPTLIFAVKPFERSLDWAAKAMAAAPPQTRFVMDVDEDEASINVRWQNALPAVDRAKTHIKHERSPLQLERRIHRHLQSADLLTVSSWALRGLLPARSGPETRLVHPRPSVPYVEPEPSERLRVGFLGTLQAYKGVDVLVALLEARANVEVHLLDVRQHAPPALLGDRVVYHERAGIETLARAFRQVDVVVLPQDASSLAARWQLPLKLLDALRHGRPVIATPTPPVAEIAGEVIFPVERWDRLDAAFAKLDALADPVARAEAGRRSHRFFTERHSAEVQAAQLAAMLDNLRGAGRSPGARQGSAARLRRAWWLLGAAAPPQ